MARVSVKSVDHQVKEFVKKISDDHLKLLSVLFKERIAGDLSEALIVIQDNYNDLNRLLTNTTNANAVYDIVDVIDKYIQEEFKKRFSSSTNKTVKV